MAPKDEFAPIDDEIAPVAFDEHDYSHEDLSPEDCDHTREVQLSRYFEPPEHRWAIELERGKTKEQKAGAALALGRLAAAEDKLGEAFVLLRQAADFNVPSVSPRALVRLVPLLERLGHVTEAEKALSDAQGSSDSLRTPDVSLDVAAILVGRGQHPDAVAVLKSVVDAWPERDSEPDRDLDRVSDDDGDLPRAVAALRLGNLLAAEEMTGAAIHPWRRALAANFPAVTPLAALRLADALARTNEQPAEIEELYRIAIDFDHPEASPEAGLNLAEYYVAQEQPKLAIQEYQALSSVGGDVGRRAQDELNRLWSVTEAVSTIASLPLLKKLGDVKLGDMRRTHLQGRPRRKGDREVVVPVVIVGAGTGGKYLLNDLDRERFRVLGLIDDDQVGASVGGVPVIGGIDDLPRILEQREPRRVFIAIPTMSGARRWKVVEAVIEHQRAGNEIELFNLPSPFEMVRTHNLFSQLRPVRVEETMGSEEMRIDRAAGNILRGSNVMVVGAGASLGVELCRQAAHARARHLSTVSTSTTALRRVLDELRHDRHFDKAFAVLGACDHEQTMRRALHLYRPEIVFHVGGHAHGSVVEESPVEAMRTEVVGTSQFARLCGEFGVKHFVLVSSEAAAEKRGVFGAGKALAEHSLALAADEHPGTAYVAVRVGNLFRSSGSVVELFDHQIDLGGPVTLTEATARRRFMRVELAAQLILRIAARVPRGRLYTLAAKEDVRIEDLAERMIYLRSGASGKVRIVGVGGRRGEHEMRLPYGDHERPIPIPGVEGVEEIAGPQPPVEEIRAVLAEVEEKVEEGNTTALVGLVNGPVREFLGRPWLPASATDYEKAEVGGAWLSGAGRG